MCMALNRPWREKEIGYLVRDLVGNVLACVCGLASMYAHAVSMFLQRTSGLLEHAASSVGNLLVDGAELAGVLALLLLERVEALSRT